MHSHISNGEKPDLKLYNSDEINAETTTKDLDSSESIETSFFEKIKSIKNIKDVPKLFSSGFRNLKKFILTNLKNFKNSKVDNFSSFPKPLKVNLLILVLSTFVLFAASVFTSIYTKDLSILGICFTMVVLFFGICFYHYYLFSRKKYYIYVVVPLEKKSERTFMSKNKTYTVVISCPDGLHREIKVNKKDYSKLIVGATYIFYFGLKEGSNESINYNTIYGFEEYAYKPSDQDDQDDQE